MPHAAVENLSAVALIAFLAPFAHGLVPLLWILAVVGRRAGGGHDLPGPELYLAPSRLRDGPDAARRRG